MSCYIEFFWVICLGFLLCLRVPLYTARKVILTQYMSHVILKLIVTFSSRSSLPSKGTKLYSACSCSLTTLLNEPREPWRHHSVSLVISRDQKHSRYHRETYDPVLREMLLFWRFDEHPLPETLLRLVCAGTSVVLFWCWG